MSGININNAEITGGKFINTNFQNSDFSQVKYNISVLGQAILNFQVLKSIERGKRQLNGHKEPITCLKISYDGRILVSGSEDCTLRVWELKTGHCYIILEGHTEIVLAVDISEDSSEIVSGGKDGVVRL